MWLGSVFRVDHLAHKFYYALFCSCVSFYPLIDSTMYKTIQRKCCLYGNICLYRYAVWNVYFQLVTSHKAIRKSLTKAASHKTINPTEHPSVHSLMPLTQTHTHSHMAQRIKTIRLYIWNYYYMRLISSLAYRCYIAYMCRRARMRHCTYLNTSPLHTDSICSLATTRSTIFI